MNAPASAAIILLIAAVIAVLSSGCTVLEKGAATEKTAVAKEEWFNYSLHFCDKEACLESIKALTGSAKESVKCAFYTVDASLLVNISGSAAARGVNAEIVLDEQAKALKGINKSISGVYAAKSKGIMHSKYCIIDGMAVLTGSFNPSVAAKNDYNNILAINSTALAAFYSSNFEKLKRSGKNKTPTAAAVANSKLPHKAAILNNTAVEVYFCPEDSCAEAVKQRLRAANKSIAFAAYSFTNPEIANELIMKASEGVIVKGVIEKSTSGSEYSKYATMAANGIDVKLEASKRLMHHKFFVIDNESVITGSFNPTTNAAERNDENIIVIRDKGLAAKYSAEFEKIPGSS